VGRREAEDRPVGVAEGRCGGRAGFDREAAGRAGDKKDQRVPVEGRREGGGM
jgi:hypothetical protein